MCLLDSGTFVRQASRASNSKLTVQRWKGKLACWVAARFSSDSSGNNTRRSPHNPNTSQHCGCTVQTRPCSSYSRDDAFEQDPHINKCLDKTSLNECTPGFFLHALLNLELSAPGSPGSSFWDHGSRSVIPDSPLDGRT